MFQYLLCMLSVNGPYLAYREKQLRYRYREGGIAVVCPSLQRGRYSLAVTVGFTAWHVLACLCFQGARSALVLLTVIIQSISLAPLVSVTSCIFYWRMLILRFILTSSAPTHPSYCT